MPFVNIKGQVLRYQEQGTGFPVLLAHSFLWDSNMWAPQILALRKVCRVIAPDLWGHGESGKLPLSAGTLSDLAEHASRLLDTLGIKQCAVVGSSVGGMWGAELAMREPGRIRSIVMMDTYLGAEPGGIREQYFRILDEMERLGAIAAPLLDTIVPLFFKKGASMAGEHPLFMRRVLSRLSAAQIRESIVPMGRLIFGRPNSLPRTSLLDPDHTLLMCGVDDIPRPAKETQEMAELIGCRYVLVPDAGHLPNLENPTFVTDTLLEWLKSQAHIPS